jgi:hypothetical protein
MGKIMSRYLQGIEAQVLIYMLELTSEFKNKFPLHDGIIIQAPVIMSEEDLASFQNKIRSKFQMDFVLKIKQSLISSENIKIDNIYISDNKEVITDNTKSVEGTINDLEGKDILGLGFGEYDTDLDEPFILEKTIDAKTIKDFAFVNRNIQQSEKDLELVKKQNSNSLIKKDDT